MDSGTISGSTRTASDFFANVLGSIAGGVERIGTEILPNWAGQQLLDQKSDLLYQPTNYNLPPTQTLQDTTAKPVLFDVNKIGTQITGGGLLVMLGLGVGGYLIVKKFL